MARFGLIDWWIFSRIGSKRDAISSYECNVSKRILASLFSNRSNDYSGGIRSELIYHWNYLPRVGWNN
jgi:hypothetical protein